eukprot:scaffold2145_cov309-Prasinococcus_capsulatus_cf.AAC.2
MATLRGNQLSSPPLGHPTCLAVAGGARARARARAQRRPGAPSPPLATLLLDTVAPMPVLVPVVLVFPSHRGRSPEGAAVQWRGEVPTSSLVASVVGVVVVQTRALKLARGDLLPHNKQSKPSLG